MRSDEEMIRSISSRVQTGREVKQKQQKRLKRLTAGTLAFLLALAAALGVSLGGKKTALLPSGVGAGYGFSMAEAAEHRNAILRETGGDQTIIREMMDARLNCSVTGVGKTDKQLVYTGDPVRLCVTANNPTRFLSEGGFFVLVDGVYQSIALVAANGEEAAPCVMPTLLLEANKTAAFELVFQPNVGKKGQTLTLSVGVMLYPSFVGTYYGDEYGYGFLGDTAANAHYVFWNESLSLSYGKDAPVQMTSAAVPSSHAPITDADLRLQFLPAEAPEAAKAAVLSGQKDEIHTMLYADVTNEAASKSVNVLASGDGGLTLSVMGEPGRYRATLMLDHAPVDLGGTSFVEFAVAAGYVSRVRFPVAVSGLETEHHVYVTLVKNDSDSGAGGFARVVKTSTEFLFVGEKPAPQALPEKAPSLTAPAGEVRALGFTDETVLCYTGVLQNGKLAVVSFKGQNAWTSPKQLTVLDPLTGEKTYAELPVSSSVWSVSENRVIAVDNPALDDPHIAVYDENAERVSCVSYDPDLPSNAGLRKELKYDYQNSDRNLIVSDDGRHILYFRSGRGDGELKTYLIDVYSGKKTEIGSALSDENAGLTAKTGLLQYTDFGIVQSMIGDRFLVEDYRGDEGYIEFSLVDAKGERVAGPVRVDSAAFMGSGRGRYYLLTPQANRVSDVGNLPTSCYVLDGRTLTLSEVPVEADSEPTGGAVSADGSVIVLQRTDGALTRVYDVESGRELLRLGNVTAFLHDALCAIDTESRTVYLVADAPEPQREDGTQPHDILSFAY